MAIITHAVYRVTKCSSDLTALKTRATVTIVILTGMYIIFNVPVFLNYTRYDMCSSLVNYEISMDVIQIW